MRFDNYLPKIIDFIKNVLLEMFEKLCNFPNTTALISQRTATL